MVKVAVMVKIIMGEALPMEFATHVATASLAHMVFGKTSTDATAAAMGSKASAAKAAGMAATP
jgi:ribose/xylose/arabinose/galactoside ABC-type transport system permease subunit